MIAPRVLVGSPSSGSGKTTLVCGLLRAWQRRGLAPISFKCGPDYIDPMFHRSVLGIPCRNLDLYLSSTSMVESLFARGFAEGADVALIEGAMGYYDGLDATSDEASAYRVARAVAAPTLLVVDARGAALTLAAQIGGIARFREDAGVAGVVLNRCSPRAYAGVAPAIERETGIPVLGFLPDDPSLALPSRHLGLTCADEIGGLQTLVEGMADAVEATVDVEGVLSIARSAPPAAAAVSLPTPAPPVDPTVVAVARDEAFCFYYEENLDELRARYAEVVEFSPLRDRSLPDGADACYLGGGYPELHAGALSANTSMLRSVVEAAQRGMPLFAECGGYLYLQRTLADGRGGTWPMLGLCPGEATLTARLGHFGYVEVEPFSDGAFLRKGEKVRAHEFHYCQVGGELCDLSMRKPLGGASWTGGFQRGNILACFPHLYFPNCPQVVDRFITEALSYHSMKSHDKVKPLLEWEICR